MYEPIGNRCPFCGSRRAGQPTARGIYGTPASEKQKLTQVFAP